MSDLSAAQLASLVAKTKLMARIEEDDASLQSDGFAIYHDESASATAATVQVTDTTVVLVITGGSNAGTDTLTLSDAGNDTLTELVTVINALSKGWVATLLGKSDIDSDRLVRKAATSAFGQANEQTLTVVNDELLEVLVTDIWARMETQLDRNILSDDYDEIMQVGEDGIGLLANPQVSTISFLGTDFADSFTIQYSGSDLTATVEVTSTAIVTRSTASNGTITTATSTFAGNASVSGMVSTLDAQSGWSATEVNNGDTTLLDRMGPRDATGGLVSVQRWDEFASDYQTQYAMGMIDFGGDGGLTANGYWRGWPYRDVRVKYTAGYTTIPSDVELEIITAAKAAWDMSSKDMAVKSEKLGDYAYTLASQIVIDPAIRLRKKYERVLL